MLIGLDEDLVIRKEEVLENLVKAKFMKKLNIWQEMNKSYTFEKLVNVHNDE